jgi:cholest-4-en-3-one 26-monooxygenase
MSSSQVDSSQVPDPAKNRRETAAEPHPSEFDVDLSDNATFKTGVPHAYFRALREHDPVHWQPECKVPGAPLGPGYWALTRHADIAHVSKHAEIFSSEVGSCVLSELESKDLHNMRQQLINMDPPRHVELRNLMNPPFKPRAIHDAEAATRAIVTETLDALEGRSDCDFVDAISAPISLSILTNFLGVPARDSKKFYKWTNKLIGAADPEVSSVFKARLAVLELFLYAWFLGRRRRRSPTLDVYSRLVNGELQGQPTDRLTQGMNFFLLVIAGNETTRNALSGGVEALCNHPDQLERLQRDPSLLPRAIEEMLRFVTPVMQFRRTATRDTRIGDQPIREGEKLVMYYGAANRDPRVFEDPETFDITREHNPHLAFGTGTHVCMGSHMARLSMRVTLAELLRRHPKLHLNGRVERLRSNFINGIKRMPVGLT